MYENRRGSSGDNFVNTIFDDSASTPIASGVAPYTGSFKPEAPLAALNTIPANGTWKLEVQDAANIDTGDLTGWSLQLTTLSSPQCTSCSLSTPGEVLGDKFTSGSKSSMDWDPTANASFYTVYRGTQASLSSLLTPANDSCKRQVTAGLVTGNTLSENPPLDAIYWYLIRAGNGGGEGTAGYATAGERTQNSSGNCP